MSVLEVGVFCFRCHKCIGARFGHEACPPIYCSGCLPAEKDERGKRAVSAAEWEASMQRAWRGVAT